jgi:hypothetical protein
MRRTPVLAAWLGLWTASVVPAAAKPELPSSIPAASALCRVAIVAAERAVRLPDRLLDAIAVVESGRRDPVSGAVYPWPWTINVDGVGHFYETKAEAISAVQDFQAHGARSIDVGCMQISLLFHPTAFASLDQAFDPVQNANYGARFLMQLYSQTNAWPRAAAAYHSQTPDIGADYARKVLAAWGVPLPPVASQSVQASASQGLMSPAVPGSAFIPSPISPSGFQFAGSAAAGRVAVMLPTGTEAIRVMPMPSGAAMMGRSLDTYRAAPINMAMRMPRGAG